MKLQQALLGATALLTPIAQAQAVGNVACDAECEAAFKAALAQESTLWATPNITLDTFYDTPANASGARPGDLLRWQDVPSSLLNTNWSQIPGGFSYSRLLYMSEDIDGKPIPASAFVLLPFSAEATTDKPASSIEEKAPAAAFKTVVWTHGTAGYARQCAPSNSQRLYYGWGGPFLYAQAGYAVVAPDYAGQGSTAPGGFQYEAGYLHAADVAYAVAAARKRLGAHTLSTDYVVVGHSEGGMTAWRTNQRLAEPGSKALGAAAGRFLGSVAIAPALRPKDLIPRSLELAGATGPLGDPVYLIFLRSLENLYPDAFRPADILTDRALALMPRALDAGCLNTAGALFRNLTASEVFKSRAWLDSPELADWQVRYNGDRNGALAAPMLVIQGLGDMLTYANNTRESFDKLCDAHAGSSHAELYQLPVLGHGGANEVAAARALSWIAARFAGDKVPRGCVTKTARPLNDRFQLDRPQD